MDVYPGTFSADYITMFTNAVRAVDEDATVDVEVEHENVGYHNDAYSPYLVLSASGNGLDAIDVPLEYGYAELVSQSESYISVKIED